MFTTLTISFGNRQKPYELKRQTPAEQQGELLAARVNAALHECDSTSVFRAKSPAFSENEQLALKIVYGSRKSSSVKALRREFDTYSTKLNALQGHVVPRCHGLFEGRTAAGYVACLVLDYVGDSSYLYIKEINMEYRLDVLRSLTAIHKAGLEHGDFSEANVVFDEQQKPWIIDFEHACPHVCSHPQIVEGALTPAFSDFGCLEIWDFCRDVGIWRRQTMQFFGVALLEEDITSVDYMLETAKEFPHMFAGVPRDKLLTGAQDIWSAVQDYQENDNIRPRDYEHFTGVTMDDFCKDGDYAERQRLWEKMIEERDSQYDGLNDDDNDKGEDHSNSGDDGNAAGRVSSDDTDETDED